MFAPDARFRMLVLGLVALSVALTVAIVVRMTTRTAQPASPPEVEFTPQEPASALPTEPFDLPNEPEASVPQAVEAVAPEPDNDAASSPPDAPTPVPAQVPVTGEDQPAAELPSQETLPEDESVAAQPEAAPGSSPDVTLSPGVYRITFDTFDTFGAVQPVVQEGTCSTFPLFLDAPPGPFAGSATYRSTGCRVHFEVVDATAEWTLDVQPVSDDSPVSVPVSISGDAPATTDRVSLPEGDYQVSLTTDSPYSMLVPIVASGLCNERPIFVLSQPGIFETTYHSTGCDVVFQVTNVTHNWELNIQPGAST